MNWKALHHDYFVGRRVLVTGAAGFIGSHLVESLVALGAKVRAMDDLSRGDWANIAGFDSSVEKITASILDSEAIARACEGCGYVFHQAAFGSVPASVEQPMLYQEVNVIGTMKLLQAATHARVRRVMFAASSSAYGDPPGDGAKVETMPTLPRSPYAATKVACEALMRCWCHSYGLDTVSLRYFNIFGPRQNANSAYAAVIAAFAKAMKAGRPGLIFGDGTQSRDFTFVSNAVQANLLAARSEKPLCGEVINAATALRISVNELHNQMASLYGLPNLKPVYAASRAGDVMHSLADISKAKRLLGYEPLVNFSDGLKETCRWYAGNLQGIPATTPD